MSAAAAAAPARPAAPAEWTLRPDPERWAALLRLLFADDPGDDLPDLPP